MRFNTVKIDNMDLLDLIFPKRCVACGKVGSYLCSEDKKKIRNGHSFCPICLKNSIAGTTHAKCKKVLNLDGLICLFHYSSPVKEMIHELKYRLVRDIWETLLNEIVKSEKLKELEFKGFTLIPTPLSEKRKAWRGFNQAEILGARIANRLKVGFDPNTLKKIKETKPQVKLQKSQRIKQVAHAFKSTDVKGRDFLLFDDVWTTGATMKAAAAALKRKGARKVWGLALATSRN